MYNKAAMNETILDKTYSLKETLKNDERIIKLNELEKKMNESEEVMALAYAKDVACDNYSEMSRLFKDDSEEVKEARKRLSLAKEKLDSHPLVKEYVAQYQVVRELYSETNKILFSSFSPSLCTKEKK